MEKLSVVVITFNEESNIERCLNSVKSIADDVVIVDSYSTDKTQEIAKKLGARVIFQKFLGHIEQKNFAITQAKYPLILSLDADEAIDDKLKEEIIKIKDKRSADGYAINRYNNYVGKWIDYGAWKSDFKLRLWDSRNGKWGGINPHDVFEMQEQAIIEKIAGNILHWSYKSVEEHQNKIEYFSDIAAKAYKKKGKKSSWFKIIFSPCFRFIRDYIFKLGFLDGSYGFIIAKLTAYEVYLKYKKLKELN
jgi:glycosyltransferase involved in cell wall biosynthesis